MMETPEGEPTAEAKLKQIADRLAAEVAIGQGGMLFHRFDWAFEQLGGTMPFNDAQRDRWVELLDRRTDFCAERNIHYTLLVVPERHVIYQDLLPTGFTISPDRPLCRLLDALSPRAAANMLYPLDALVAGRLEHEMCYRTDQHLTDDGGYVCYRTLYERLAPRLRNGPIMPQDLERRTSRLLGDLGIRLSDWNDEAVVYVRPVATSRPRKAGSHQLPVGRIDIYESSDQTLPRAVWFGDSHSFALLPFLAHHFSRLVTVQTDRFLTDLIEREAPEIVVSQTSEVRIAYPKERDEFGVVHLDVVGLPKDGGTTGLNDLYDTGALTKPFHSWLTIDFGKKGNSDFYCLDGWSDAEPTQRWSIGNKCTLRFPIPPSDWGQWRLVVELAPYLVPVVHPQQRLEILINGRSVRDLTLCAPEIVTVDLPFDHDADPESLNEGSWLIEFRHPDAKSPTDSGIPDKRVLGMAFRSLSLTF